MYCIIINFILLKKIDVITDNEMLWEIESVIINYVQVSTRLQYKSMFVFNYEIE